MKPRWPMMLVAGLCLQTCGGDEEGITSNNVRVVWAETLCEHANECDCESAADYKECRSDNISLFSNFQREAEMADLKLDPDCVQSYLDLNTSDCSDTPPESTCEDVTCSFWYGTAKKGEACDPVTAFASECEQGLTCFGGECVESCAGEIESVGEGDTCFEGGDRIAICESGLVCDDEDTGTCLPRPAVGEPCISSSCESEAYCDFESSICTAQVGEGESCIIDFECTTLSCDGGVCGPREPFACLLVP